MRIYVSKYNLSFDMKSNNEYVLYNPLSGAIDIVNEKVLNILDEIKNKTHTYPTKDKLIENLFKRGYVFENDKDETNRMKDLYQAYQDWMALTPRNFVLSTTYSCNLDCLYCFQAKKRDIYKDAPVYMKDDMLLKAFDFMVKMNEEVISTTMPQITIYGGEPLQADEHHMKIISLALQKSKENNFSILVISNGTNLLEYVDILTEYGIHEIQVTLDGPREVHNRRRPFTNGRPSFDKIVAGVDACLEKRIPVNLRFVGDRDNIDSVPDLVKFMQDKGWYESPAFKTHIGRMCCGLTPKYEHNILTSNQFIKKLIDIYDENEEVAKKAPSRLIGMDRLLSSGMPYPPIFDSCPGTKLEFALDALGKIYPCSLGVGMEPFLVGEYYPEINFYEGKIEKWQNRNIFSSPDCAACNVSMLCGGGCPRDALEKKGSPFAPGCRSVKQNLQDSMEHYYKEIKEIAEKGKLANAQSNHCS